MEVHHLGVVHLVDVVAGENHDVLGVKAVDEVDVLVDGVGGALVPALLLVVALVGGQDLGAAVGLVQAPGLTVADIFIQLQGLILGQDAHGIDAGVDTVGQGEVNNAVLAAEGDGGLGGLFRQDIESAALATGQQHGNAAFFLKVHWSQLLMISVGTAKKAEIRNFRWAPVRFCSKGKSDEGVYPCHE